MEGMPAADPVRGADGPVCEAAEALAHWGVGSGIVAIAALSAVALVAGASAATASCIPSGRDGGATCDPARGAFDRDQIAFGRRRAGRDPRVLKTAAVRAGITNGDGESRVGFHTLGHTCATRYFRAGADVRAGPSGDRRRGTKRIPGAADVAPSGSRRRTTAERPERPERSGERGGQPSAPTRTTRGMPG